QALSFRRDRSPVIGAHRGRCGPIRLQERAHRRRSGPAVRSPTTTTGNKAHARQDPLQSKESKQRPLQSESPEYPVRARFPAIEGSLNLANAPMPASVQDAFDLHHQIGGSQSSVPLSFADHIIVLMHVGFSSNNAWPSNPSRSTP